jgi:hypothetical protein
MDQEFLPKEINTNPPVLCNLISAGYPIQKWRNDHQFCNPLQYEQFISSGFLLDHTSDPELTDFDSHP